MQILGKTPLQWIKLTGHINTTWFILPPLMVLVVIGTIAQPFMGLYQSQHMFFSSWFIWAGPIPVPSGMIILSILALSLLSKFIFYSTWRLKKSGIILSHLGVLILLIGGFLTSINAQEGFMILAEGNTSAYVYDYTKRDLFIFKNDTLHHTIAFSDLQNTLDTKTPFKIIITEKCANCIIEAQDTASEDVAKYMGLAANMRLSPIKKEKEPEENLSGITFELSDAKDLDNGTYIAFENMPRPIKINHGADNYKIIFGKQQRLLPFQITLKDFVKTTYPNSGRAKSYHSDIIVKDILSWPARISMNKPLRYKGYTLFQSSFSQTPNLEASVLAVVKNDGYIFAYIGTALLGLGLLLHCLIMMLWSKKRSGADHV